MIRFCLILYVSMLVRVARTMLIESLDKYCRDEVLWIGCTGLNYTGQYVLTFEVNLNYSYDDVRFHDSKLPVIPGNTFKIANIERLQMSSCGIEFIYRKDFYHAYYLNRLVLAKNELRSLEKEVFVYLPRLTYLDLEQNKISEIDDGAFRGLANLRNLFLERNHLKNLSKSLFSPLTALTLINLSDNEIEILDDEVFDKNLNLTDVILKNNKLKIIDVKVYTNHKVLRYLLENFTPQTIVQSDRFLAKLLNIEKLQIDGNFFPHMSGKTFDHLKKLRELGLSSCQLTTIDQDAFIGYDSLKVLDLSSNGLDQFNVSLLFPAKSLKKLYINNNSLSELNYRELIVQIGLDGVNLADNNWNCSYLSTMMDYLKKQRIATDASYYRHQALDNHVFGIACVPSNAVGKNATYATEQPVPLPTAGSTISISSVSANVNANSVVLQLLRDLTYKNLVELEHLKEMDASQRNDLQKIVEILAQNSKKFDTKISNAKIDIYAVIILCNISTISIYVVYKLIASKYKKQKPKGHIVLPNQLDTSELIERNYL